MKKEYKITLTQFWKSKKFLVIQCKTEEEANKLLEAFDKLGKTWCSGTSYLGNNFWNNYTENTCYSNKGMYGRYNFFKNNYYIIYKFNDVDLDN